jgi:serine/threonine-protein kinase HipA
MIRVDLLHVKLMLGVKQKSVGRLAYSKGRAVFEMDPDFPIGKLNLSPFRFNPQGATPLAGPPSPFEGLHGVFADSLPDGWGRLLTDRVFREAKIDPATITPIQRLALVGDNGVGALTYHPQIPDGVKLGDAIDLEATASEAIKILEDKPSKSTERLRVLAGNSGGARPKATIWISADGEISPNHKPNTEAWLVKFPSKEDDPSIGRIEYAYSDMMREAGIDVPETQLLQPEGAGFFATKRFDRIDGQRPHVHTLAGLLECDFRIPSVDYIIAHKAAAKLTRDVRNAEEMFRRMSFNVFAKNRDDHAKNHSFSMNAEGEWRLTPAYDVVLSDGMSGEHALMVGDTGRDPTEANLRQVGKAAGLTEAAMSDAIDRVRKAMETWWYHADKVGLAKRPRDEVASVLGVKKSEARPVKARQKTGRNMNL